MLRKTRDKGIRFMKQSFGSTGKHDFASKIKYVPNFPKWASKRYSVLVLCSIFWATVSIGIFKACIFQTCLELNLTFSYLRVYIYIILQNYNRQSNTEICRIQLKLKEGHIYIEQYIQPESLHPDQRAHWKQLLGTEDWSTTCSLAHPQMGTILERSSSSGIEISSSDPNCVV